MCGRCLLLVALALAAAPPGALAQATSRLVAFELSGTDTATGTTTVDRAIILYFRAGASHGWDAWDATKLFPLSHPYALLAFEGERLGAPVLKAQDSRPGYPAPFEASLRLLTAGFDGPLTLRWPTFQNVPADWGFTLTDLATGAVVDLRAASEYAFTPTGPDGDPRFTLAVTVPPVVLSIRLLLQGPYREGALTTVLRDAGHLPLAQPYAGPPWSYPGPEAVETVPPGVVDWVLAELRAGGPGGSAVARRAAFLRTDGTVVAPDGTSPVTFAGVAPAPYYVAVRHRNHLGAVSAGPAALSPIASPVLDLTGAGSTHDPAALVEVAPAVWALRSGDGNGDGVIDEADRAAVWRPANGTSGYLPGDYDLSGAVTAHDAQEVWAGNAGAAGPRGARE